MIPAADDAALMRLALAAAEKAAQAGEVPVGAVLQLPDGRRFTAHNAPITLHDPTAHAEIRAIRAACRAAGNYRLPGATLTVTLEPCPMCAAAIVHARIGRVIYGAKDPKTGAVESLYRLLSDPRLNHRPAVTGGVLAGECGDLLRAFFRARRS
ncbi:MAG: tRNA adenosine(34) deaminase TadA [Mariprofundaceae bacterium]